MSTIPEPAECMGTVPHGEHPFNGGMHCPGLLDPQRVISRKYIEAKTRPGYTARDILEIATYADGTASREVILSFPPGTPVTTPPETIDALHRAYQVGREDKAAETP